MKRILLTGHTGFIGSNVKKHLEKSFEIIGTSRYKGINLDLATDFSAENILPKNIDAIIHLAAQSNVNECEKNKEDSYNINVQASVKLAKYALKNNIPFIFASSDQVYEGTKYIYTENDEAKPLNEYGKQKLQAEKEILFIYPKAVVLRFALVVGKNGGYEKTLIENLKQEKSQTLFVDEMRSVVTVENLCQGIEKALMWQGGVYNMGGSLALNRYELGMAIAQKHKLDALLLNKGIQNEVKLLAQRPKNVVLNSDKAVAFGWENTGVEKEYL